jgi:hypothetical protein
VTVPDTFAPSRTPPHAAAPRRPPPPHAAARRRVSRVYVDWVVSASPATPSTHTCGTGFTSDGATVNRRGAQHG